MRIISKDAFNGVDIGDVKHIGFLEDEIPYVDVANIIFEGHSIEKYFIHEYLDGKMPTFKDLLDEAIAHGFNEEEGILTLILESSRYGFVFKYKNYGEDRFYCVGKTIGLA